MASDLTPQERRLIDCAAKGKRWEPKKVDGKEPDMDPANADKWDKSRTIRAAVLRCILLGETWPGEIAQCSVHQMGLQVEGARVDGPLNLDGASLNRTLWLDKCRLDDQISLCDAETRSIGLEGSYLREALLIYRAHIRGDLYLRFALTAMDGVSLAGSTIEGNFECDASRFQCADGHAVDLDGAKIGGSVFLRGGFGAKGAVKLRGATIARNLDCGNGTFEKNGGVAFDCRGVTVGANVFLTDGFAAIGEVDFMRAKITGYFHCESASFFNPSGDAIDFRFLEVGGGLRFRALKATDGTDHGLNGRLRLDQARCRTYGDDRQSWPQKGKLTLDGFVYERFEDCETDWKTRREWLKLQNADHLKKRFRPQPWTQVINVLRAMGHDDDAREIGLRREQARAKSASTSFLSKLWLHALWWIVGNGYKPWRAVGWSLLFVALGWFVFAAAAMKGYIAPRDGNVRVSDAWRLRNEIPDTYPVFNGLVYALDAYLPVIEFEQDESWEPSIVKTKPVVRAQSDWTMLTLMGWAAPSDAFFEAGGHRVLYWVEEFLGWMFVSLFIAGMSGIMKKE